MALVSRLPLIARLALALGAAALLPLAISLYQLKSNHDALQDQIARTHLIAATTTASRIGVYVGGLNTLAESLAANPELARDPRSPAVRQLLGGTLLAEPDLAMVGIFDPEWRMVVQAQRRDLRDDVAPLLDDRSEQPVRLVGGNERRWLRLLAPVRAGADDGVLGRVVLIASAEPVAAMLQLEELPEEAELLLASSDGTVLFPRGAVADEGLAAVMARAQQRKLGESTRLRVDGGDQLVAYDLVAGTPWFVLSRQSARSVEVARLGIWRATLVAIIGAVLLPCSSPPSPTPPSSAPSAA
ncbi:MAG: hypothetical protein D6696_20300 [Acidobacteria bacterium]|nr:MAG: hypothetical protein D6696_20300 [Acidobacteriota bacterium]